MNYEIIYELMIAFGIASCAGMLLILFGARLWEMRCAELELKRRKRKNETRTDD